MKASEFDIFEMNKGIIYPEDHVTVYTDMSTAYEIDKLDKVLNSPLKYTVEDPAKLEEERKELVEKLKSTSIVVHLQGLPDRVVSDIRTKLDAEFGEDVYPPARLRKWAVWLVAKSLRKAVFTDGTEQDLSKYADDYDKIDTWFHSLPKESQSRIDDMVAGLSLKSNYFENAEITSDF